jgi:hypothetical protein
MTAQIIQMRDYQSKADLARMYDELTLEQQASVLSIMLLDAAKEDTAPSELPPPEDQPA